MALNDKITTNKKPKPNSPVIQQFVSAGSGGSAVPTAVPPYDVEKVSGDAVKPAPKPAGSTPSK